MRSIALKAILSICVVVITGASTVFAAVGIVGRDPVPVSIARSQREAKEALEKGLPGAGGRALLVSPHDYLGTLLLPLRKAGVLKELIVLLPHDNVLTDGHLEELRGFLEKGGIPEGDRKTLRFDKGSVRGAIEGMPVLISTLKALPKQVGEFLVVLDTAFLPAVYKNEVKTPMVDLARRLTLTLADRNVGAKAVVILDAVGRADFPLDQGYLPGLLRELISTPGDFADDLPEKWRILKAADGAFFFSQYAEAMLLYKEYLGKAPGDASACHKIATMAYRDLDVDLSLHWLVKAVEADPLYRRAFSDVAGYFFQKELFEGAERVLLSGLSKFPKDPLFSTNLSAIYLSRGEAARDAGDPEAAREFFSLAAGIEGAEPRMRDRARSMAESLAAPTPSPN
ncbi:MAG: hypothetical protein PHP88_02370 [bacterium]|nr:hypothetical protein [bacterium]